MKSFLLMLQFFTRLPINIELSVDESDFQKGIIFFPLVGLIIGSINAAAYYLLAAIFPRNISVIFVVLINVLITGALHIDGLADTCDGIFSSRKKESMLEIMKDSRIGTNGALAVFFDLALRIGLIYSVGENFIIPLLILSCIISRTILVFLCYISKYARENKGLGSLFIGKVSLWKLLVCFLFSIVSAFLLTGYTGILIIVICIVFFYFFERYINSKIHGITGDILGAANELCELIVIMIFLILKGCEMF